MRTRRLAGGQPRRVTRAPGWSSSAAQAIGLTGRRPFPGRAGAAVATASAALQGAPALPRHRPAWLLPEPLPVAERGPLPLLEGRPLQLVSGPERIEAGWWDGPPAVRDYFIAQADDGSLVWVYRTRLPVAAGEAGWFLQGRFA